MSSQPPARSRRPTPAAGLEHELDPETGLPIGPAVDDTPARAPEPVTLDGQWSRLEPLGPQHAADLFAASSHPEATARFRYLFDVPPRSVEEVARWLETCAQGGERAGWAVLDRASGVAEGRFFLMRIHRPFRRIELGNVYFGPRLARTRMATEAVYLIARYALDELGYRRFEWKCDALNAPSRRAALRFGFTYEGTFRRDVIVKGRTRDTAWYALVDADWPPVRAGFERWLDPANFDARGHQRARLEDLRD